MKKKSIIIVIAILAIVSIIIGIRELYYISGKKLSKEEFDKLSEISNYKSGKELSKEEFELLKDKINEIPNYKIEETITRYYSSKKSKDKIREKNIILKKDELYANINEKDNSINTNIWSNSKTKEEIHIDGYTKTYVIYNMDRLKELDKDSNNEDEDIEYKFIRIWRI